MKKLFRIIVRFFRILYKILPFFLGIYCYYPVFALQTDRPYPFLDSVYGAIKLYYGSTEGGVPVGGLLQLARFLAMAATLSILIELFDKVSAIINGSKLLNSGSTVVYGDSCHAERVFEDLNFRQRIRGKDKFIRNASRYMLMFSDDTQNIEFYNRNYEGLKDKKVYIMLENVLRQNIENPLVTVFSAAENCARQYWKDFPVEKSEKIAVIGFGNVGKNILLYGLQMNIIDPNQNFEYHIYGDGTEFRQEHTELDKMLPDEIIFHDNGIFNYAEAPSFDRIIICGGRNENCNIETASKLLAAAPVNEHIYIYAPNGDIVTTLFGEERLVCFGMAEKTLSAEKIFNEESMKTARRQNEFYCEQYGGAPWEKLDCFKRYSNVSSSDFVYTLKRLREKQVPFDTLAELEHIRWCRYYYLNNWKYGAVQDDRKRIHNSLIPYSELSYEEKVKDAEAIKIKFGEGKL